METQVVTQLMIRKRQSVRDCSSNQVCQCHELKPRQMGRNDSTAELKSDHGHDNGKSSRVRAIQLLDLRVLLQDEFPSGSMGFVCTYPKKVLPTHRLTHYRICIRIHCTPGQSYGWHAPTWANHRKDRWEQDKAKSWVERNSVLMLSSLSDSWPILTSP